MQVKNIEREGNQSIGKVVQPFSCCDKGLTVYNKKEELIYTVEGGCCQVGFWCGCPCESCQTIDFDVRKATGEHVGFIQKV